MDHIWTIENWEQNIDFMEEGHRTGFRLRFDSGIDPEVRRACKEFAAFLRKEYFFPLRVVAYIKNKKKIRAMDGDLVYGTFWSMEDDYTVEPYIRVAAGDYLDLCDKWGKDSALTAILLTIGHELTHYFQWINALELTLDYYDDDDDYELEREILDEDEGFFDKRSGKKRGIDLI